jgi:hypothetical protein
VDAIARIAQRRNFNPAADAKEANAKGLQSMMARVEY